MVSAEPTTKQPKPLNFAGALLLYSHRRDVALGFEWHSQQTLGLIWYYNQLIKKQVGLYASADYLRQMSEQNRLIKNDLMIKAKRYKSPEKRKRILEKLQAIEEKQERIAKALDNIG